MGSGNPNSHDVTFEYIRAQKIVSRFKRAQTKATRQIRKNTKQLTKEARKKHLKMLRRKRICEQYGVEP